MSLGKHLPPGHIGRDFIRFSFSSRALSRGHLGIACNQFPVIVGRLWALKDPGPVLSVSDSWCPCVLTLPVHSPSHLLIRPTTRDGPSECAQMGTADDNFTGDFIIHTIYLPRNFNHVVWHLNCSFKDIFAMRNQQSSPSTLVSWFWWRLTLQRKV